MRISFKCLLYNFIVILILLNVYFFTQLYVQEDNLTTNKNEELVINNEFWVLDWTGNQHIFKEPDTIKCDFSHITSDYCQSKFNYIDNHTLRLQLIKRCTQLPTLTIRWTAERSYLKRADLVAYHSIHMPRNDLPKLIRNDKQQQFSTVYVLESEINSANGEYWHKIDFPVWYNLERSYPAPATYFDLKLYLNDLFAPIRVPFSEKKTSAPIVWIAKNCNAYNGRQNFIKKLMSYIKIDSYGKCHNTIQSYEIDRRVESNTILYSKYKFVISMENSNCEDYISEKLIEGISSSSVPIVASRNNIPDYTHFAPKHSYINIYDYKSVKELADYLNYLSQNETAYNEYLWFRQLPANKYASSGYTERSLSENLRIADEILGKDAIMRKWLLTKETSINKYCKIAQFIYTNYWKLIYNRTKINRPRIDEVCLPRYDLVNYFSI